MGIKAPNKIILSKLSVLFAFLFHLLKIPSDRIIYIPRKGFSWDIKKMYEQRKGSYEKGILTE